MIAYAVLQRQREIGIRIALGASTLQVFKQTVGEGMLLTVIGEGVGLAAALLITRLISRALFRVTPTDPLTFGSIALLLGITGLFACYLPARRAAYVDPVIALRSE